MVLSKKPNHMALCPLGYPLIENDLPGVKMIFQPPHRNSLQLPPKRAFPTSHSSARWGHDATDMTSEENCEQPQRKRRKPLIDFSRACKRITVKGDLNAACQAIA